MQDDFGDMPSRLAAASPTHMPTTPPPLPVWYYLDNFQFVLQWLEQRYSDLLDAEELGFMQEFARLPRGAQGLLVRMIMRKGQLFRASKLHYAEIGDTATAAQPLIERRWILDQPTITLDELFKLFTKAELAGRFRWSALTPGQSKQQLLDTLRPDFQAAWTLEQWERRHNDFPPDSTLQQTELDNDRIYKVDISAMCDRFRLMFFGNLNQEWNEFVLSDLGLYTYQKVDFPESARAFQTRQEVDDYLHLHGCKDALLAATEQSAGQNPALDDILAAIPDAYSNEWLESRRGKLLLGIGRQYERRGDWARALDSYGRCMYRGVRARRIRVLERSERPEAALALARLALQAPESEEEHQTVLRMIRRLERRCGQACSTAHTPSATMRLDLALPDAPIRVEEQVKECLSHASAPVFYVENGLVNSLFGLLCWDAVFAAVPGAFFHPFQQGPADLLRSGFHERRRGLFETCLDQLRSGQYLNTIRRHFDSKAGIQSPFVYWGLLSDELLELALQCMPAEQLGLFFRRLLQDIRVNRSGLPDLIQFWPAERRYQLIEVKGPGDRLQYNQLRWLDFCSRHDIPASVCYVSRVDS